MIFNHWSWLRSSQRNVLFIMCNTTLYVARNSIQYFSFRNLPWYHVILITRNTTLVVWNCISYSFAVPNRISSQSTFLIPIVFQDILHVAWHFKLVILLDLIPRSRSIWQLSVRNLGSKLYTLQFKQMCLECVETFHLGHHIPLWRRHLHRIAPQKDCNLRSVLSGALTVVVFLHWKIKTSKTFNDLVSF